MTDNEAVLRDLLLEMGVRGAECITPLALACLADYMREDGNETTIVVRQVGALDRRVTRWEFAFERFRTAMGRGFDLNRLHGDALELPAD